jgi:hypothetical protein
VAAGEEPRPPTGEDARHTRPKISGRTLPHLAQQETKTIDQTFASFQLRIANQNEKTTSISGGGAYFAS